MSLDVSGNLSSGLPFFNDTNGCSFSLLDVSWLLATRATLLAFLFQPCQRPRRSIAETSYIHSFCLDVKLFNCLRRILSCSDRRCR